MAWLTVGVVAACAVAFFIAAEESAGLRHGRRMSFIAILSAAGLFLASAYLLITQGLADGPPRVITVAVAAVAGLACFWWVKLHVDHHRPAAAFQAAVLGLVIFGVAFVAAFGRFPTGGAPDSVADNPLPQDAAQRLSLQLSRFAQRQVELDERLLSGIPAFRRRLSDDAAAVKRELAQASDAAKVRLTEELREIARLLVALDGEEAQVRDLISRVRQEQRRLERLRDTQAWLGDDAQLQAELDAVWDQASQAISRPLDRKLGVGAIEESQVDQRVGELLR